MAHLVRTASGGYKFVVIGGAAKLVGNEPPPPPFDANVLVTSTPLHVNAFEYGLSHIQHSIEYYTSDVVGSTKAYNLVRDASLDVRWQMTHMTEAVFALQYVAPTSVTRQWTTTGSQRGLEDAAGQTNRGVMNMLTAIGQGKTVLTAFGCPAWMRPGRADPADPPTPAHFTDFANLVVEVCTRYPQIRAVNVWNELKGWYSASPQSRNQASMYEYADLATAVGNAVRAYDPSIEIWAPHYDFGRYSEASGRGDPLNPSSSSGFDRNAFGWILSRFVANGFLPDRLTVDYSLVEFGSPNTGAGNLAQIAAWTPRWATVTQQVDTYAASILGTHLPIVWIEDYFDVQLSRNPGFVDGTYTDQFQAAMLASMMVEQMNGGAAGSFRWQPESRSGYNSQSLWRQTGTPGGSSGSAYAAHGALRTVRGALPTGAQLYALTVDDATVSAASSATKAAVVNRSATTKTLGVFVNGVYSASTTLAPWDVQALNL